LFKGVNLLLEGGEKLAVLGTNGVGKNTLLKTRGGELDARQRDREMVGERAHWVLRAGSRI
ncbi:hypothetical protein XU19_23795, partial [Vibrio parahaemolyticus]